MAVDLIRYDILTQEAMRGVVRSVLLDAAAHGLPGEHHFFISFDTRAEGVKVSPRLRAQYPEEMTIVLQHQFWDLSVTEDGFEVGLSFNGVPERLTVPLLAVTGFADPSVQFALQFGSEVSPAERPVPAKSGSTQPRRTASIKPSMEKMPSTPQALQDTALGKPQDKLRGKEKSQEKNQEIGQTNNLGGITSPTPQPDEGPDNAGGAEVVRLDRFRKK